MPGCSGCTCMLVCAFLSASCTRDRGCSKHPAFPAPSHFRGQEVSSKPRAIHVARMRTCIHVIACDKREAFVQGSEATKQSILSLFGDMDFFATLAMTVKERRLCQNGLLKNLDPFSPYRHGRSAAFVIPIRTPTT